MPRSNLSNEEAESETGINHVRRQITHQKHATFMGIVSLSDQTASLICVLGGFFALFSSFGMINVMGLFQLYYQDNLLHQYSASAISWISTMQLFVMFAFCGIHGRIIDTYGIKIIIIPSAILATLSMALLSLCRTYVEIFLAQGVGFGIGASGMFACAMVACGQWFTKYRALAMGIVTSGSSIGGVIHPIYIRILIQKIGFPGAVRYTALVIGICTAISCVTVATRLPSKNWDRESSFFNVGLFKKSAFTMYCVGSFLVTWGLFAPWNYLPSMALSRGFSYDMAIYAISILNAGSVVGRILPAYAADRIGRMKTMNIICVVTAILLLAFWLPIELTVHSTHVQILVFGVLYGFTSGAWISLSLPCVAEIEQDPKKFGQTFGTYLVILGFGGLTGLPIEGALIRAGSDSFLNLIIFSGVTVSVGTVAIFTSGVILA